MQLVNGNLSARAVQKTRNESKKLQMYSKQWLPGDCMRVFYPIFWQDGRPEIAVGAIWGHSVSDPKELGLHTIFIPSTTDFDENAQPIGQPDITYQFSLIAKAFVDGAKAKEEQQIDSKPWANEAQRKEALMALEAKYDAKNNSKAVRPIIGRARYFASTEVLSVKLVNNVPNVDSIAITSQPLSNQTINRLYQIMDDPKFAPVEGDEFFEVEWKYPATTDKGESGRQAMPTGLTNEYKLSTMAPAQYAQIAARFDGVSRDAESIVRRAVRMVDPEKVRKALTNYTFMKSEYLDVADEENTELLVKHADLIKELEATRAVTNVELREKIEQAINEMNANRTEIPPQTLATDKPLVAPTPEPVAAPEIPINPAAPSVDSLLNTPTPAPATAPVTEATPAPVVAPAQAAPAEAVPTSTPSVENLMNNPNNAGAGMDEGLFETLDLSALA